MRSQVWILSLALSVSSSARLGGAGQTVKVVVADAPAVVIADFSARVRAYVSLRKNVEDSFTVLRSSNDSAEIAAHKIELAAMIVSARSDAGQGDIFTPEIAMRFRDIIRMTFQSPGAQSVRRTVQDKDPATPIVLRVNLAYPENSPLQMMPPTLLARLPDLPMDMGYRIIGRALVLLDNKTRLIVDFIPAAVP